MLGLIIFILLMIGLFRLTGFMFRVMGGVLAAVLSIFGWLILAGVAVALVSVVALPIVLGIGAISLLVSKR